MFCERGSGNYWLRGKEISSLGQPCRALLGHLGRSPANLSCWHSSYSTSLSFCLLICESRVTTPAYQRLKSSVECFIFQSLSRVQLFVTPRPAARQASLSFTISWSLLKLMSIKSVMPSNHLILCYPSSPPALNLSQHQGLFQWVNYSSNGLSIVASTSASVVSMTVQDWCPLWLTGLISLQSRGLSRVFSNTSFQKHNFSAKKIFPIHEVNW